jgi:hypothetical protein
VCQADTGGIYYKLLFLFYFFDVLLRIIIRAAAPMQHAISSKFDMTVGKYLS